MAGPGARWSRAIRTWPDVVRRNGLLAIRLLLIIMVITILPGILPILMLVVILFSFVPALTLH